MQNDGRRRSAPVRGSRVVRLGCGAMRLRIEVEVCIEVDTIERPDDLQSSVEEAVVEAVGDRHIADPEFHFQ